MNRKPKALVIIEETRRDDVYGPDQLDQISCISQLLCDPVDAKGIEVQSELLEQVEIIFGGWGMPELTETFLERTPNLKAVFYAAGTVKSFATDAFFDRNIVLTNAHVANAVPVAEYCLATILFSLKHGWKHVRRSYTEKIWIPDYTSIPGAYGSTVGLISLGAVGTRTLELLRQFNVQILVNNNIPIHENDLSGFELVDMDDIFKRSDVVSVHTAGLPETEKMIRADHFRMMPLNATFINTSRGSVVDQDGMIEVLKERTDLTAVLDVTEPEPPEDGDVIFQLPNIFITPHLAGSLGKECRRLGQSAIDECKRYLAGEPLCHSVVRSSLRNMS